MAWCPSGAYDVGTEASKTNKSYKRMGLLAAACSSGNVNVFSVPFPEELKSHEEEE